VPVTVDKDTEKKVLEKLGRLRDDKAAGADDLVPRFLNGIKCELVSPPVILFREVLVDETSGREFVIRGNSLLWRKFGAVFLRALFWGPCYF